MTQIIPNSVNVYEALTYAIEKGLMLLTDGNRTVMTDKPIEGMVQICAGVKK